MTGTRIVDSEIGMGLDHMHTHGAGASSDEQTVFEIMPVNPSASISMGNIRHPELELEGEVQLQSTDQAANFDFHPPQQAEQYILPVVRASAMIPDCDKHEHDEVNDSGPKDGQGSCTCGLNSNSQLLDDLFFTIIDHEKLEDPIASDDHDKGCHLRIRSRVHDTVPVPAPTSLRCVTMYDVPPFPSRAQLDVWVGRRLGAEYHQLVREYKKGYIEESSGVSWTLVSNPDRGMFTLYTCTCNCMCAQHRSRTRAGTSNSGSASTTTGYGHGTSSSRSSNSSASRHKFGHICICRCDRGSLSQIVGSPARLVITETQLEKLQIPIDYRIRNYDIVLHTIATNIWDGIPFPVGLEGMGPADMEFEVDRQLVESNSDGTGTGHIQGQVRHAYDHGADYGLTTEHDELVVDNAPST
ncbi:hypothetical protein BJ508DRAFT_310303, partial [Ascobolus immersus RN42]